MHTSLRLVNERFEACREMAARLFESDETFRDLCEDYEICALTVARMESNDASSEALHKEYSALLLRLERELLEYLERHC
jgi:hypothetical protein